MEVDRRREMNGVIVKTAVVEKPEDVAQVVVDVRPVEN